MARRACANGGACSAARRRLLRAVARKRAARAAYSARTIRLEAGLVVSVARHAARGRGARAGAFRALLFSLFGNGVVAMSRWMSVIIGDNDERGGNAARMRSACI